MNANEDCKVIQNKHITKQIFGQQNKSLDLLNNQIWKLVTTPGKWASSCENGTYHVTLSLLMTKPTKWHVRPVMTQISLGIRPVWSETLLSPWRKLRSLANHWAHSENSDQTGQMPRLIWIFAGCTVILLVLLWGSSNGSKESFRPRATSLALFRGCACMWALSWQNVSSGVSNQTRHKPACAATEAS